MCCSEEASGSAKANSPGIQPVLLLSSPLKPSQSFLLPPTPPSCPGSHLSLDALYNRPYPFFSPFCLRSLFENFTQIVTSVNSPCSFCSCLCYLQDAPSRCKSALGRSGQLERETSHINIAQNRVQLNIYLGFLVLDLPLISSHCQFSTTTPSFFKISKYI